MKKQKFLASILAMTMVFSMGISANAKAAESSNTDLWVVKIDADGNTYLENTQTHEEMIKAYRLDESGNPVEINLVEHAKTLNETTLIPTNTQEQSVVNNQLDYTNNYISPAVIVNPVSAYSYTETRNYRTTGSPIKVTPDVRGPTSLSYGESKTISESFATSVSLSAEKSAIIAGASFTWEHSLQSAANFGVSYDVPAGRIGYIHFKPYFNVSVGNLTETVWVGYTIARQTTKGVFGLSPVTLGNGLADGLIEFVLY